MAPSSCCSLSGDTDTCPAAFPCSLSVQGNRANSTREDCERTERSCSSTQPSIDFNLCMAFACPNGPDRVCVASSTERDARSASAGANLVLAREWNARADATLALDAKCGVRMMSAARPVATVAVTLRCRTVRSIGGEKQEGARSDDGGVASVVWAVCCECDACCERGGKGVRVVCAAARQGTTLERDPHWSLLRLRWRGGANTSEAAHTGRHERRTTDCLRSLDCALVWRVLLFCRICLCVLVRIRSQSSHGRARAFPIPFQSAAQCAAARGREISVASSIVARQRNRCDHGIRQQQWSNRRRIERGCHWIQWRLLEW